MNPKNSYLLRALMASLCLLTSLAYAAFGQAASGDTPALDSETGLVHSRRLASGVPLGGIGTGTFQLMTDGAISHATITNNWQQPTDDLPGCFFALWTRTAGRTQAHILALRSPYNLPTVTALDYDGQPPQATLTYPDKALPVSVTLRAFSPLVPFDIKNSSFPAAAFVFQFRNKSSDPVEVSIALSWENLLGVGGTAAHGFFHNRTGDAVTPLPSAEGFFGLRFTGPPLTPGNSLDERLQDNATGNMALLALLQRKEAIITQAGWNTRDALPGWWNSFAQEGRVSGDAPTGIEGKAHPAGVIAVRLTLKPDDYVEIPFAVAWYTPRYNTLSGVAYRHYDAQLYPDAVQTARTLLTEWRSLLALTEEWQQNLSFSNLPRWLVRLLRNSITPLQTNSIHTDDGKFILFSGGAQGSLFPTPESLRAADALLSDFFPQLQKERIAPDKTSKRFDAEYSLDISSSKAPPSPLSASHSPFDAAIAQIVENKPEEGIAALQKLDEIRNNGQLSPWVTFEGTGVASLAQAEDWMILDALNGFAYDAKNAKLIITPRIPGTWRSLVAPIFTPTFWGRIEYKPRAHGGLVTFRLDRLVVPAETMPPKRPNTNAQLSVASLRVPGPPRGETSPTTVHISLLQMPLGAHIAVEPASGDLLITLDTSLALAVGDRLEIDVH